MTTKRVLNCVPSTGTEKDWKYEDGLNSDMFQYEVGGSDCIDLREDWWEVDDQGQSGACVGFATAYGVLRWHYVKKGIMAENQKPSARFIWMSNKETDEINTYPSTFLEIEGTQTKRALQIAREFGCVVDDDLPMNGDLNQSTAEVFYESAKKFCISSYHNLGTNPDNWKRWLEDNKGPILTRLDVDGNFWEGGDAMGVLANYDENSVRGGHAVCIVGCIKEHFIIRNSWGTGWGDKGFAYATYDYAKRAFTEAYGAVL